LNEVPARTNPLGVKGTGWLAAWARRRP
jgi:hypothetical protein